MRGGGDGEHRRAGVRTSPSAGAGSVCGSNPGSSKFNEPRTVDRSISGKDRSRSITLTRGPIADMGAATEFAVLLEDAVWRADAEATAPAIAEEDVANDLFVVPVDEGGARGGENAAVAARALRAALREQTTARHSLERERESLVEREKLLSKQISRAKRRLERLDRMVRDAEALAAGWSDDETTSDRRGLGLGLVVKREFAPNADAERPRARRTKKPERKMTWEEMRAKLDAATVRAVDASDVGDETIREVGKRQWETLFPNAQPPKQFKFGRSFIRDVREKINVTTKRYKPTTTSSSMTKTARESSGDEIESPQTPRISKRARKQRFAGGSWEL